jgi:magnesium chelatase subunit D
MPGGSGLSAGVIGSGLPADDGGSGLSSGGIGSVLSADDGGSALSAGGIVSRLSENGEDGWVYPLAALAGQKAMVEALLLLAVDPSIGGALLVGEKGTAKSTAARALAELLPPFMAFPCPYSCRPGDSAALCPGCREGLSGTPVLTRPPFRTVPLGVTEERLLGGLDFERTLRDGRPELRPGILGEANNGLLYIDEVNLLDPSLAHLMLDAVSSGRVSLERDGFSLMHPARVALLGSMNPEEGPLGPQLSDRFALAVELRGEADPETRAEIVRRRLAFERDPRGFRERFRPSSLRLARTVAAARAQLPRFEISDGARTCASEIASEAHVAGHRADLALCLAARAKAAWDAAWAMETSSGGAGGDVAGRMPELRPGDGESADFRAGHELRPGGSGAGLARSEAGHWGPEAGHWGPEAGRQAGLTSGLDCPESGPVCREAGLVSPGAGFGSPEAGVSFQVGPERILEVMGLVIPGRRRAAARDRTVRAIPAELVEMRERDPDDEAEPAYVVNAPENRAEWRGEGLEDDPDGAALQIFKVGEKFSVITPKGPREIGPREQKGRRGYRETLKARGRAFRTTARRLGRPLSLSATLRAAAPRQRERAARLAREGTDGGALPANPSGDPAEGARRPRIILAPADFREKVYRLKTGRLVVFVVDSSGSIGTLYRMEEAKAAALSLLTEAYQKRDRVAVIAFYDRTAEVLLPPTNSPDLAGRLLSALPSGGKTPLSAALALTHSLLRTERAKDPMVSPHVILMTDGRPNVPLDPRAEPWRESLRFADMLAADPTLKFLLIDTDRGYFNEFKLTRELAQRLGAPRMTIEELREGRLEKWLLEGGV